MRHLERRKADKKVLFEIGSALDNDKAWQVEEEKNSSKPKEYKSPSSHALVLKMEKRQGKPVSIVGPFFLEKEALSTLCSTLKKKLSSGGSIKEEWLEFQGECREKIKVLLTEKGFRFK